MNNNNELSTTISAPNQTSTTIIHIAEKINKMIALNTILDYVLLEFFNKVINTVAIVDYYGDKAKILSHGVVKKVIVHIFNSGLIEKGEHQRWLKLLTGNSIKEGIKIIEFFFEIKKCEFDVSETIFVLKLINTNYNPYTYINAYIKLLMAFIENNDIFEYNKEILELATHNNCQKFAMRAIEKKITITDVCVVNIVKNNNLELFEFALSNGANISGPTLDSACEHGSTAIMKYLLDNKIQPTKKSMEYAIKHQSVYPHYGYRKINPDREKNKTMINMLRSYGYIITYDDVLAATKLHITIDDFESLGIKLDVKFLEICSELSFYPYKTQNISPNQACLEKECGKSSNLSVIRKLINQGIVPTQKCIQNACKIRNNLQVVQFLISKGLKIDTECINFVADTTNSKVLTYALDQFFKNMKEDIDNANDNKKLKNKVEDTKDLSMVNVKEKDMNSKIVSSEIVSSKTVDAEKKTKKKVKSDKADKPKKTTKGKKKLIEEDDNSSEQMVDFTDFADANTNIVTSVLPPLTSVKSVKSTIVVNTFTNPPENYNYRVEREIDSKVLELLELKAKSVHSFLSIRKSVYQYLTKTKLVTNDIIKLNKNLADLIKRPIDEPLKITDIERIVYSLMRDSREVTQKVST